MSGFFNFIKYLIAKWGFVQSVFDRAQMRGQLSAAFKESVFLTGEFHGCLLFFQPPGYQTRNDKP